MAHEMSPGIVERDAANAANYSVPRKKELLAKAGLSLGVLAAALTASIARPNKADANPSSITSPRISHPLEDIGVTSNRIWVPDLNQARQAAQAIAATNANTVRIFEPYNMTQTQLDFDRPRLCNAAEAARENNLTLEISIIGVYRARQNGKEVIRHNYVPSNAGGVSRYLNFVKSIIMDVAGPDAAAAANGVPACVEEPLTKLIIEDFNEVNSPDFNSNVDAAKGYAYLESKAIPDYAKITDDINQSFENTSGDNIHTTHLTLIHAIGALAAANHDPIGFLRDFDKEIKRYDIKNPNIRLAVHPYPADPSADPAQVEASLYGPIRSELDATWGKDVVPIFYDEIGVNAISADNRAMYGTRSLQAATVQVGTQAQYYKDTIVEASMEEGVSGVLTFQSQDVRNDGWPSGIYNPKGNRKNSWNTVAKTFHDALEGTLQK